MLHFCHVHYHLTNFEIFLTRIHIFNLFFSSSEIEIINNFSSVLKYSYRKQTSFKLFLFAFTTEDHSERESTFSVLQSCAQILLE